MLNSLYINTFHSRGAWSGVSVLTGMLTKVCVWVSLLLLGSSVRVSRVSLTRMDTALRMKEANRFIWMLFLIQWSFLVQRWQCVTPFDFHMLYSLLCIQLFFQSFFAFLLSTFVLYIFVSSFSPSFIFIPSIPLIFFPGLSWLGSLLPFAPIFHLLSSLLDSFFPFSDCSSPTWFIHFLYSVFFFLFTPISSFSSLPSLLLIPEGDEDSQGQ